MRKLEPIQRICQQCGCAFFVKPHLVKIGSGKYCTNKCATDALRKPRVKCNCLHCGKEFETTQDRMKRGGGKYCTMECHSLSQRKRVEYTCHQCGTIFTRFPYEKSRRKFCSNECRYKAQQGEGSAVWRGGSVRYGVNWITQRDLAYERDGGVCQYCGRKPRKGEKRFEVHHIVKVRTFKRDYEAAHALSNLITLCKSCHGRAEHGKIALPVRLL